MTIHIPQKYYRWITQITILTNATVFKEIHETTMERINENY